MRVSAKREGCSEAKPLGDAGREREARAEGRLRPVGAGGAKPQEAAQFLLAQAAPKVIHRRRVKNRLIKKGLKTVMACGQMTKHYIEQHVGKHGCVSKVNSARVKGQ